MSRKYTIPPLNKLKLLPPSRSEASKEEKSYYFTGKMCKHGHVDMRYTKTGSCRSCSNSVNLCAHYKHKENRDKYRKENQERLVAAARKRRKGCPKIHQEAGTRYRAKRPAAAKRARDNFRKNNPEKVLAGVRKRRAQKVNATPPWANSKAITAVYKKAILLTEQTGKQHHVDHIIPLCHPLVCGLHCESNLRVIPAADNLLKNNRFDII